jgi:hypothetical protein
MVMLERLKLPEGWRNLGSRGYREFLGLVLRRVGQMEDFETYERIASLEFFEWPSEMEKKIERCEAQTIILL